MAQSSKPSLSIASLNCGRLLQLQTRGYLYSLINGEEPVPDVLCLQDIPLTALPLLQKLPHVTFAPMTNHLINGMRSVVGNAIASRHFMTNITHHTTWGDGKLKDLQGINDKNQRYLGAESDTLVEATEDRVAICATVIKDDAKFDIATTHGMWVRNGVTNDVQRESTCRLIDALAEQADERRDLVLAADMNFGRGGEIYNSFTGHFYDRVPQEIESTLDPDHPVSKKGIKVVSDYIMTAGRNRYAIDNVQLTPGIGDHCLLSAKITKL